MSEKSMNQEFKLRNIERRRNYFIEEINQIELMSIEFYVILSTYLC